MIETHPNASDVDVSGLAGAIGAFFECVQACTSCADACLAEEKVAEMRRCIRLNLDCADVCAATAALASRLTTPDEQLMRLQLEACKRACAACHEECSEHASEHEHCRICAESCKRCEEACDQLLSAI